MRAPWAPLIAGFVLVLVSGLGAAGCDEFGCGTVSPPTTFKIDGNYSGTQITVGACADHSALRSVPDAGAAWKVTDKGSAVSIDTGDACTPLTGTLTSDTVDLDAKPCTAMTLDDGGTETDSVTGGTVQFTETSLSFSVRLSATVSDAKADGGLQACSGMNAGTLTKGK